MTDNPNPPLAVRLPAIEYHHTEYKMGATIQMKAEWFLAQMQWLSDNGYQPLTGDELVDFVQGTSQPPQKSCVLRFDLGQPVFQNFHDVIFPALEKFGFHAIFLVLTNMIKDECKDNYICWDQLKEWQASGLVEIGSHGVYHPDYKKLTLAGRKWDAKSSKLLIETKIGHPVRFFGFPFDSVPTRSDLLLKPLGYSLAFAGYRPERSIKFKDLTPYSLPCYYPYCGEKTYPIVTGTKKLTFGQMISGAAT